MREIDWTIIDELCDPDDEFTEAELAAIAAWPNCSVPDFEDKPNVPNSDKCCGHQHGLPMIPFDEYMAMEPSDD